MLIPDLPPLVHTIFEAMSYFVGARLYLWQAARRPAALRLGKIDALWVAAGAVAGAALGSKVVYWMQYPTLIAAHWREPAILFGGKTIVGGLLGGLAGVELTKAWRGIRQSTGDDFVVPLIVGMSIGRIGCFLAGIPDNTYGIETSLPWAVTYSDGIPRHRHHSTRSCFFCCAGPGWHDCVASCRRPATPSSCFSRDIWCFALRPNS